MNFFKLLCDVLNHEHWRTQIAVESLLSTFFPGPKCPNFSLFSEIFSITFLNSMCIIEKRHEHQSRNLGARIIVGNDAQVNRESVELRDKSAPST
jgi:hypothetical protein